MQSKLFPAGIICFVLVALLSLPAISFAQEATVAAPPARPEKACLACDQGLPAQTAAQPAKVVVYLFWGDGCPHCAEEKPFLEQLAWRYPQLELRMLEVWHVPENRDLFFQVAQRLGFEPSGVPVTIIGDRYWVGYNKQIKQEIEAAVAACVVNGCVDIGQGLVSTEPNATRQPVPSPAPTSPAPAGTAQPAGSSMIDLPVVGQVNLATRSLGLSTALIAFVDGFNPCSLWVLSILLALTLHTGSRKKVFVIGFVFLTITSLVYVLFIVGLFTMFTFVSFLGWIQIAVAILALFFAGVNIKDYFWYKEGLSFTIADEKKPGIYKRMRSVLEAGDSLWGLLVATVGLAMGVSLVEFSCTAGFPVLWTNLLAAQQVDGLTFGLLLLLYMAIYQLDEMGIFIAAVLTLKSSRLEEKHGRILKLVGGMLMLTLAAVMLINPALMNNVWNSLLIFGVAFGATAVVLLVHRQLLPRFGIVVGSEAIDKAPRTRRAR